MTRHFRTLPRGSASTLVSTSLLAVSIWIAGPVEAGPDSVAVLLGSHHVGATGFEEVNPGVFFNWHEAAFGGRVDLGFGAFRNSYGHGSVAVTAGLPLIRDEVWGLDLFSALAWYPDDGDQFEVSFGDIVPIVGIQARWRHVFVQAIPGGGGDVDATVTYGLVFPLE